MTINQRFDEMLSSKKISQSLFAEVTGMDKANVSNIANGRTKQPKSDFFEAIARHFPEWLFWITTGDEQYYPKGEGKTAFQVREPEVVYEKPYSARIEALVAQALGELLALNKRMDELERQQSEK